MGAATIPYRLVHKQAGLLEQRPTRPKIADPYLAIEEWVQHSEGEIRTDVVHDKLQSMGYR